MINKTSFKQDLLLLGLKPQLKQYSSI